MYLCRHLEVGTARPEIRQCCLEICGGHVQNNGIDSVILDCTVFPLVISGDDLAIAVPDTTVVHVEAILAAAS